LKSVRNFKTVTGEMKIKKTFFKTITREMKTVTGEMKTVSHEMKMDFEKYLGAVK
jgi:hypothetical protein